MKSLDLEKFSKKQKLDEFREGFEEDFKNKQQVKYIWKVKAQRDKEDYIRMCNGKTP